jgi:hypothetical protein
MRKFLFAVSLMLLPSVAQAQFKSTLPQAPTEFPTELVCGIISLWPPEKDDDPVHVVEVIPGFDYSNNTRGALQTLLVKHTTIFGRVFTRSDQYSGDYLRQTPGQLEIIWRGTLKKNGGVKMVGRIWNERSNGRWYYSENIEDNGQPRMKMLAGCHKGDSE